MFIAKVFSFFFVCLLAACGNSVSQTENTNHTLESNKIELNLKMERTACFGNCPVYTLTIQPDGKFFFDDVKSIEKGELVTKIKHLENKLSEEKMKQIIAEIDKTDFFSLKNDYTDFGNAGNCATDNPTVILTIKLRGREKQTKHDLGCRGAADVTKLTNLENKIDETVETKRWIGEGKY